MSVAGYLGKQAPELGMPREGTDELGVTYSGPVLSGEKSPESGRKEDAAAGKRRGERYESVDDYDPVLRSHCRL